MLKMNTGNIYIVKENVNAENERLSKNQKIQKIGVPETRDQKNRDLYKERSPRRN